MKNWTIGKRITLGFALIITLVAGLAITSFIMLRQARLEANILVQDALPAAIAMSEVHHRSDQIQLDVLRTMLAKNPEERKKWEDDVAAKSAEIQKFIDDYEKNIHLGEDRDRFQEMAAARANYKSARDSLFALCDAGKSDEAIAYNISNFRPSYIAYTAIVDKMANWNIENAKKSGDRSDQAVQRADFITTLLSLAVIVAGIVFATFLVQSLKRVLTRMALVLDESSNQSVAAAGLVSSSSQGLAEGASEQASSLEETSSSLEEMAAMTKRNAENARQANDIAKQAREAANKGVSDMQTMSAAMEAIKVSSDDIAKIIKTIDEIAFQTNILALNAAVEAARAGEAGMGFAVVADEVRTLAQRCAQAAKETAGKIEGAIAKTGQGVEINGKVAAVLNDIVTKVRQVDELVTEVAGASREQTDGITQINSAVGQMDKVTQSNAASAEETAAAAEELNGQAEIMKQSVGELLALVGGKKQPAAMQPAARKGGREFRAPEPTLKIPAVGSRNGNGHGHSTVATAKTAKRRDEIPMEGDFKDF
jgi:methyl-accepting chemotaxis protein